MKPNGFVEAAFIASCAEKPIAFEIVENSLANAMFTCLNEFSNSLFRYFITSCVGIEKNLLADSKVRKWKKERTFTYTPDKREYLVLAEKVPAGIVYNMSGEFDKEVK